MSIDHCLWSLICASWLFGVWDVVDADDKVVLHLLGLEHYLPCVPFWLMWKTVVVDRAKGLGLMMCEVIGPAFRVGHQSLVSHEYDVCGGVNPHVGLVSDEVMHGC